MEVDFDAPQKLWVAAGKAIEEVSLWIHGLGGHDVRVAIARSSDQITIRLDRGARRPEWWTEAESPRLVLDIDGQYRSVQVMAAGGDIGADSPVRILERQLPEP